ncbi:NAD(P)-binding protein [Dendrothele bispora CBS 962.96]|uniref:NAD(P)-binding protein n=1 Tax=Dendrothele bispora (strain CBS 962.96) TaxID=1314807 RepID=A0A4V4HGA8_DENBC|nr:NAD(P)-binding protein [Dendrothele bispora CBS 962.96]
MATDASSRTPKLVWLITGTSSGFGKRFAISAIRKGDAVIATSRTLQSLQDLPTLALAALSSSSDSTSSTDSIIDISTHLHLMELDVNWDTSAIHETVKKALDIYGRVDVLVNNAGWAFKNVVEDVGSAEFKTQFQTNFFGLIDVTNAVLPQMRQRRSGTVVMMGSRSSWTAELPVTALYAASKAAVRVYTETLATELAPFSVRFLIVEPGAFRTEGIHSARPYQPPQFSESNPDPRPEYAPVGERMVEWYRSIDGNQKGNPDKAVELIVDIVKEEGKAKEKIEETGWPLYLVLGKDGEEGVREKCQKMLKVVDEWGDFVEGLEFEN